MIDDILKIDGVIGAQICGAGLGGCFMVAYDKNYDVLSKLNNYDIVSCM